MPPKNLFTETRSFGFHPQDDYEEITSEMKKLKKSSLVEFVTRREALQKQGLYTLFHPKTGELKIIKAKDLAEATAKLRKV